MRTTFGQFANWSIQKITDLYWQKQYDIVLQWKCDWWLSCHNSPIDPASLAKFVPLGKCLTCMSCKGFGVRSPVFFFHQKPWCTARQHVVTARESSRETLRSFTEGPEQRTSGRREVGSFHFSLRVRRRLKQIHLLLPLGRKITKRLLLSSDLHPDAHFKGASKWCFIRLCSWKWVKKKLHSVFYFIFFFYFFWGG